MKYYSESGEWIYVDGDIGLVGLSRHVLTTIGDIVAIEFPAIGELIEADGPVLILEASKMSMEVYTPVTGRVLSTNTQFQSCLSSCSAEQLELWLFKISISNHQDLDRLQPSLTRSSGHAIEKEP